MKMNLETVISENEYIFEEAHLELSEQSKPCYDKLTAFFKDTSKCLFLEGDKASGKSFLIKKALYENASLFSRVYYIEYDKEKYINVGKTYVYSIDQVLKKNIYRIFLSKGMCKREDNVLECFENSLDENSLLVIDNYDIPSFSPYIRHLLQLKCKLVVVTRTKSNDKANDVRHLKINNENNYVRNPLCEKLKRRYCDYFGITYEKFEEGLRIENGGGIKDETDSFLMKLYSMCYFDDKEKELLRTLGAMLYYLSPSTEIKSSDFGVFDVNCVKYYLKDLSIELEKLIFLGFLNVSQNGALYFDRAVLEFVMNYLKPDSNNCLTFVSFVKKVCDFTVVQSVKNTDGRLYTYDKRDYDGVLQCELMDLYTHFLKTDENRFRNVYNILICNTLESFKTSGVSGEVNHLLWKNKNAYFSILSQALSDKEFLEKLYDFDERYDMYCDSFTDVVFAKLDILRIAGGILNGAPKYLYFDFEMCFDMIYEALNDIFFISTDKNVSFDDRMSIIFDAVRVAFELFGYCSVFNRDACSYNKRRSLSSMEPIQSTSVAELDRNRAVSINMAYSVKCVKLYGAFQRLLYEYKRCADIEDVSRYNSFYKSVAEQKKIIVNKAFCDISSEYSRIIHGYDSFYDFFSKENTNIKIWQSDVGENELEQKLGECKRLAKRGFDSGTKTGGGCFAKQVITATELTKNAAYLVNVVLSGDFEIGDNTYFALIKNDFAAKLLACKNISKTDKVLLLEGCIDSLCEKQEYSVHFELLLSVIKRLLSDFEFTPSERWRICERLSFAYLKALCREKEYVQTKKLFYDNVKYEDMPKESAVCYFVYALKCYEENRACGFSERNLSEAAKTVAFENMHRESDFDFVGFLKLAEKLCGEECADEIREDLDLCKELFI